MKVTPTSSMRHPIQRMLGLGIVLATSIGAQAQTAARPAAEARLPGLEATSGLFRMPSAYVQRDREITAFAAGARNATGGALVGLGQRLELGVAFGDLDRGSGNTLGSAKLNLVPEALITPTLSIGILDAFDTSGAGRSGYIVVSKFLIPYFMEALTGRRRLALKLHAGYGGGLYRSRPFAGVEIWGDNGVGILGEVVAGRVNVGARYYRGGVGVMVGWLAGERVGGSLCYTLSLR